MVIDLTALSEGETRWSQTAGPEDLELELPDFTFGNPIAVRLAVNHVESQYILKGWINATARTRCVKCLEEFELAVDEEIGWVVQVIADPAALAEQEESDDFWFIDRTQSQLEIAPRVRETVLINLPAHPVCRTDCRGLCPRCGANLNQGPCGCTKKEIDNHWGPLKDLLNVPKNNGAE